MTDENWPRAEERFRGFINNYPNHKNVDAALYYLGFALFKRDKLKEAEQRLNQLVAEYPKSNWADDAKALLIQIAAKQGNPPPKQEQDAEMKIYVLQSICQANPQKCAEYVA